MYKLLRCFHVWSKPYRVLLENIPDLVVCIWCRKRDLNPRVFRACLQNRCNRPLCDSGKFIFKDTCWNTLKDIDCRKEEDQSVSLSAQTKADHVVTTWFCTLTLLTGFSYSTKVSYLFKLMLQKTCLSLRTCWSTWCYYFTMGLYWSAHQELNLELKLTYQYFLTVFGEIPSSLATESWLLPSLRKLFIAAIVVASFWKQGGLAFRR